MSKRSIRLVAGIAGAAMALGSMAPAMAARIGGDDVDVTTQQVVNLECLEGLAPDLFPLNANVSPADIFDNFPGLIDLGLSATSNDPDDGQHLGLLGTPLYGALGTAGYLLDGVIDAGQCVTEQVVECLGGALAAIFPINVNVNPEHPVQTGSIFSPGGAIGGLLDVGLNDTDNVDNFGTDGPHLGVFGNGPLGIYGIPNTLLYVGGIVGNVVDCIVDGDEEELLGAVTGMTGGLGGLGGLGALGGSPLGLLSPVTSTVFGLTSSVTSTLGLGILGGGGGLGLDASLLASVAAIL